MADLTTEPILSVYTTVGSKLSDLAIKDGQFIWVQDKRVIALDFGGKRTFYTQIEELATESARTSLLAPVAGLFYFVIDTASLWTYRERWIQLTTPPQEVLFIGTESPEDTSVLWVDPSDDSDDGFQEAVNIALAQAKASGEFDGVDGKTPVKGVDYFDGEDGRDGSPGKDGSDGVSATHYWNGTVLTVTSASGTSSADLKGEPGSDGKDGSAGADGNGIKSTVLNADYTLTLTFDDDTSYTTPSIRGATGATGAPGSAGKDGSNGSDGSDGVGIASIKQTTTSTADGGNNVFTVTMTNDTSATFTVRNGSKGSTPVKGIDYLTDADKNEIAERSARLVEIPDSYVMQDTAPEDTSVLWIDPTDNSNDGFQEAVNIALAQAKASGEFDGPQGEAGPQGGKGDPGATGQRGTGILKITTAPSSYTTATGGFTPTYRIALSTVKTQSKASDVLAGDTIMYSYYHYPVGYVDTSYVYLGTRNSIRGATGAAGTTPVKGTDYFTAADKAEMVNAVIAALPVYAGEVV